MCFEKKRGGGGRNLPREMIREGGYDGRRTRSGVKWGEMEGRGKGMSVLDGKPGVGCGGESEGEWRGMNVF